MDTKAKNIAIEIARYKNDGIGGMSPFVISALEKGFKVCIFASNQRRFEVIRSRFFDNNSALNIAYKLEDIHTSQTAMISNTYIPQSFTSNGIYFVSDQDFLGQTKPLKAYKKRNLEKLILESQSMVPGELVVHKDYGIGKFVALERMQVDGLYHDVMQIEYRGKDCLYVPVEQIDVISRYGANSNGENGEVVLDSLKSSSWQERVAITKNKIKDIARDLLALAAKRKLIPGETFQKTLQYEDFCNQFDHTETQDQLNSIAEIEKDLSSGILMNRLLCGDVGFGKTEVVMRAAAMILSGASGNPQVCIIVPTTILAKQHYHTFKKRFSKTAARIEVLSRMNSAKEAKDIKTAIEEGKIDIIIGTHALLSKSINFNNLKLLVIDEEHLFGVEQKEKLQKSYPFVHTLCVSATPIPRTLYMALSGIRDISVIASPPAERLVVKTGILYIDNEDEISSKIDYEIKRNGGIFVITPHISEIDYLKKIISRCHPAARIEIAHGKMKSHETDMVISRFSDGECDVLISTSIIASGVDIPHANTIIIHKADNFGLGQLYQMRGRVGRSDKNAFCYFMLENQDVLKRSGVFERLSALLNIQTLGAGFSIASFDLDIRGGGNLVGEEQSGKIKEIGLELYQEMLKEEIEILQQGSAKRPIFDPVVELGLSAFIPDDYISDIRTRISFYRKIGSIRSDQELTEIFQEIQDRFGKLPASVENLRLHSETKLVCIQFNIMRLIFSDQMLNITFHDNNQISKEIVNDWLSRKDISVLPNNSIRVVLKSDIRQISKRIIEIFTQNK